MENVIFKIFLSFSIIIIAGCNGHFYDNIKESKKFKIIYFYSDDPYNLLIRIIKDEIRKKDITIIISDDRNIVKSPFIQIISSSKNKEIISIFNNGKVESYKMTLSVQTKISIPNNKDIYSINLKVCRLFFENSSIMLSKNSSESILYQEMYREIAQKLIQQFTSIQFFEK